MVATHALRTAFLFSGQGSQYFQMGRPLFDANPVFRGHMLRLDGIVRRLAGRSVLDVLYSPHNRLSMPFDQLSLSHPAIVIVEYALAQTMIEAGIEPDLLIGASLGFFTAAAVSGALSIEDALAAAIAHAAALEARCAPGGMVAILASPSLYEEEFLRSRSALAAVNYDSHFVVAGSAGACDAIEADLTRRDIVSQRIPVRFAFHSHLVDVAEADFAGRVASIRYRPPHIATLCCAEANVRYCDDAAMLWDVTRRPIRFADSIARIEASGGYRYFDLGPAGTLATFLKYLLPADGASRVCPILTPFGRDVANWDAAMSVAA